MVPMASQDGVSNAGPLEEGTVARADGTITDVVYPDPERVPEDPEPAEEPHDEAPDLPKNTPRKRTPRKHE